MTSVAIMSQFPLFMHLVRVRLSLLYYRKHNHIWTVNTLATKYGHNLSVPDDGELWSVT